MPESKGAAAAGGIAVGAATAIGGAFGNPAVGAAVGEGVSALIAVVDGASQGQSPDDKAKWAALAVNDRVELRKDVDAIKSTLPQDAQSSFENLVYSTYTSAYSDALAALVKKGGLMPGPMLGQANIDARDLFLSRLKSVAAANASPSNSDGEVTWWKKLTPSELGFGLLAGISAALVGVGAIMRRRG